MATTFTTVPLKPATPVVTSLAHRTKLVAFRGFFHQRVPGQNIYRRSAIFSFEVAVTPHALQWGLSRRPSLPPRHGMLFDFGESKHLSFWGRDTMMHLDLAFLDEHGRVQEVRAIRPQDETEVTSAQPARYGLEVAHGTFAKEGIRIGDELLAFEVRAE